MLNNLKKLDSETDDDFFVRVGKRVLNKELTWLSASNILNSEFKKEYGESAWRKRFRAFYSGMNYQLSLIDTHVDKRILSISDLHIPFQKPISVFSEFCGITDVLQLNGDITDCQPLSKFPKTYRKSPMEEILETRAYLISLIDFIKPKEVVVNYGNHDMRFQNYLAKNLDSDILELMPKTSLELILIDGFNHYNKELRTKIHYDPLLDVFNDIKITYNDKWFSQIGKSIFCHPLAYSSGIMQTSENARRYFKDEEYCFDAIIMAHTHRTGCYDIGTTTIYEQGAACETSKQHYSDGRLVRSQREGFIYVCQDKNGCIVDEATRIIKLN